MINAPVGSQTQRERFLKLGGFWQLILWLWQFRMAIMGLQISVVFELGKYHNERNIIPFFSFDRFSETNGITYIGIKGGDHGMS